MLEVLVVLAIAATLSLIAAPSFTRMIARAAVDSHVTAFVADARFARSEAMVRSQSVTMCRVQDPDAVVPTCVKADSPGTWADGWMIFVDLDADNERDTNEPVLRIQQALADSAGIEKPSGGKLGVIRYRPSGRAMSAAATLRFRSRTDPDVADAGTAKTICISFIGRIRVAGDGAAACES